MRTMKTLWLLGAAALAFGLSGCGGGSNTRPATPAASATPPAGGGMDEIPPPDSGYMGAGMVTVDVSRAVGGSAVFKFKKGEDDWTDSATPAASTLTGWSGSAVQDASSEPIERIVAYTNIDEAEAKPFHEVKGMEPYMVMPGDTVVPTATANFPSVGSSFTFEDKPDTTETNEGSFAGTLGGATGTFTCNVDSCTVSRLADDDSQATYKLSPGWSFTANDGQTIEVSDDDYLAFGHWNKIAIASLTTDVVPFYYGSMPYAGNVQALSGNAVYTGNAAGGYEHKTYATDTGKSSSTFGYFTAGVRLNAFFGGEDGVSTIDGMVDGFALVDQEGGANPAADWKVMLERTEVTGQSFMGTTNGGRWKGAFFGPSVDDMGKPLRPSGVAGGFDAVFQNGAVKGAYGATTQQ